MQFIISKVTRARERGSFSFFRSAPSRIQKGGECSYNEEKLNRLLSKVRGAASFNTEVLHSDRDSLELSLHKSVNREEIRAAASDLPGARWDGKLDERHARGESVKSESNYRF